jgi:hypothetical protein
MSFSPVNPEVYASAQAGAMAGMAGAGVLTDPDSADYSLLAASAAAFAQEMDTVWAATPGVVLSGTVDVINGSEVLLFSLPQSLAAGEVVEFTSQPGVAYKIATATNTNVNASLTTPYTGTTAGATTTTTLGPPLDEYGCKVITMASFQLWAARVPSPIAAPQWAIPATYANECAAIAGMVQEGTAVNVANGTVLPPCPTPPSSGGGGLGYAMFYGTAPGDYAATIAVGANIDFPHAGPTSGAGITRTGAGTFQLAAIGTYDVSFNVGITEAGQFELTLGGALVPSAVASRTTGTCELVMRALVTTTVINEILTVQNPPGNATALTVTPADGNLTHAPSANLTIVRLA